MDLNIVKQYSGERTYKYTRTPASAYHTRNWIWKEANDAVHDLYYGFVQSEF